MPAPAATGRKREWCSDRCRRDVYLWRKLGRDVFERRARMWDSFNPKTAASVRRRIGVAFDAND